MKCKRGATLLLLFVAGVFFTACQKEIDDTINGVPAATKKKPRLGTTWTYIYITYYSFGGVISSSVLVYKASSEETIGGEKWLRITDTATMATVFLVNEKTGSLYQYSNNSANLFFKYPAAVNDTYNTYNAGKNEDFIVKGVNDSLSTGVGDIAVNHYEGRVMGVLTDEYWYNDEVWIAWHYVYRNPVFSPVFRYSTLFLQRITY
jgi:hypothetical protein